MELPVVTDSQGLVQGELDPGEYTREQIQLLITIHEIGHAAGCDNQHTVDPTCAMFKDANNWEPIRAGHFSFHAREQLKIHNSLELLP
jgi:hypothetical protein